MTGALAPRERLERADAPGRTIVARVRDIVDQDPHRVFASVLTGGARRTLSYGALFTAALRFCRLLQRRGVRRGEVVIIILTDPPELYASFLGAMLGGFVPAFMPPATAKQDPAIYWSSHARLFESIAAGALVTFGANIEAVEQRIGPVAYPILDAADVQDAALDGAEAPDPNAIEPDDIEPDDIAFLQHSSGTTGLKKGVMLNHRSVLNQVDSYARAIGFDGASRVATWLPLYHDMGLISCFIMPLALGAEICQLDPFEWVARPWTLFDAIEAHRSQYVWMPNFAFNHLVATARPGRRWDLSSIRTISNCSEPCKTASMQAFRDRFSPMGLRADAVQVCYALAENVFAVTQTQGPLREHSFDRDALAAGEALSPSADGVSVASCGKPIDGAALRIVDERGEALPDGRIGDIQIGGASLYCGYNKRPDLTAAALVDGWHRTGDLGALLEGELFVTGRKDDLIVARGRNYYAHDLEAIVSAVAGVAPGRVVAFGAPNAAAGSTDIVCLFEPAGDGDPAALRRTIRETVETHCGAVLAKVIAQPRGSLVKTTSGKMSREANRARFLAGEVGA